MIYNRVGKCGSRTILSIIKDLGLKNRNAIKVASDENGYHGELNENVSLFLQAKAKSRLNLQSRNGVITLYI